MEVRGVVIFVGLLLVLGTSAWVLALVVKRVPDAVPRPVKIAFSGTVIPLFLLMLGFISFEAEQTFLDWVLSRPLRTYFLVPGYLMVSCAVAWIVLRDRGAEIDVRTFE